MAEEAGRFDFGDVVHAITAKLVRRHPHVFSDAGRLPKDAVNALWERIKAEEKAERAARRSSPASADDHGSGRGVPDGSGAPDGSGGGALAGVPKNLPALTRALKLQEKAGKVGFDWNDPQAVLAKIREETEEIARELASGRRQEAAAETGDLLFAVVNLARHIGADPEAVLRATNVKFERRFGFIEQALAATGKAPQQSSLSEMDALWDAAKTAERTVSLRDK
jgi:ATP diphosphatase